MAYITLGTSEQVVIKVPTLGSTDWGDTLRTDTFLVIAEHDHTGSGSGTQISTGALATDSVTGAKIRLANEEYLKARNAANSANISMVKVNASDKLEVGVDLANLAIINNTFLTSRNAADSAYIDMIKVNATDEISLGADVASIAIVNNTALRHRNAADSGYITTIKVNTSDEIELGAVVASAEVDDLNTSHMTSSDAAVVLADNQVSIANTGILSIFTGESVSIRYRLVRDGDVQSGELHYHAGDAIPSESFRGVNVGVTFSILSNALYYQTTSTGSTTSFTYIIIKE